MNWDAIGAIGEIVGALAVVLTLGYLAIQTRHNAAATQSSTELEASKQFSSFVTRIANSETLQRIWDDAQSEKTLSPEDYRQYLWLMADCFHMSEGIFIQHQKGYVSDEVWGEFERLMLGFLQTKPTQEWWSNRNSPFSNDFFDHIEKLIRKDPEWVMPNVVGTSTK
jgi:hypothetical protein